MLPLGHGQKPKRIGANQVENLDYGIAEIEAIKTAISFFEINGDAGAPQLGELIENLESAILAIQTHVLPESHPMAVN